ncbi:MAG: hypothetical protein Kow00127_10980 [Bacteroidales bacterium]
MTERSKIIWVYLISGLYIAFNVYLLLNRMMWGGAIPVLLILVLLYFLALDKVILLTTFLTPVAVNISDMDLGASVSLPTEPLMFGLLVFFLLRILRDGGYERKIVHHPLSIAIVLNLLWIFITSITSEMPLVSFKYLLSRLWFVIPFYFLTVLMFKKVRNIQLFFWLYIIPFTGVIVYTIINHAGHGLDQESGNWVMRPFYNDHTAYGAVLAMYIPVLFGFIVDRSLKFSTRLVSAMFLAVFLLAIVLSYSRAAWLTLAIGIVVAVIVYFRIRFRWVFISLLLVVGLFVTFQQQIFDRLEKNKQDSSTNFVEHVRSISNISTDASNLERINRWQSALRMFRDRPFWGFGPGTYQFQYAPYQRSKEKTIISTNAGDRGNAHSEYIGPLSESGVLGGVTIFAVFLISVFTGLRVYKNARDPQIRIITLSVLTGLISYYLHGFLNNFLDTDKASVPVWGFMAILVALDLYVVSKEEKKSS